MLAGAEVDGERDFLVGHEIPAIAVECVAFDCGDADALPAQALRLPSFAIYSPREDGMEAAEEKEIVGEIRVERDYRLQGDVSGVFRVQCVDDVGVASCDGADLIGVGAGMNAVGHRGVSEAESAGGEEAAAACGTYEELESAACECIFFAGNLLRVGELMCGGDEEWSFEDLSGPGVREGSHSGQGSSSR